MFEMIPDNHMNLKKIMNQLDVFIDSAKSKQIKKHDKMVKIINSLEGKKAELKKQLKQEAEKGKGRKKLYHLCQEYKVVLKLLRKAKNHTFL